MATRPNWLRRAQNSLGRATIAALLIVVIAYDFGKGTVVDQATGKPIQDVYLVARWSARSIGPVHSSDVCFKVTSTKTDKWGEFFLWPISWNFYPLYWWREREILVYAAGYKEVARDWFDWRIQLARDDTPLQIREEIMFRTAQRSVCGTADQRKVYVRPVFEAMIEEAASNSTRLGEFSFLRGFTNFAEDAMH